MQCTEEAVHAVRCGDRKTYRRRTAAHWGACWPSRWGRCSWRSAGLWSSVIGDLNIDPPFHIRVCGGYLFVCVCV